MPDRMQRANNTLNAPLANLVEKLIKQFDQIPSSRKDRLTQFSRFVEDHARLGKPSQLNFICTHNSRRSHIAQLWALTAAHYYGIPGIRCYSGGTEATAFNPRAVRAMQAAGFSIHVSKEGENPVYEVQYATTADPVLVFSKTYDDPVNPTRDFAAIMTCSHADQNCPVVIGASTRIALTYDDPKDFDGTPQEEAKYKERVEEIGRELLYAFSMVKPQAK